MEALFKKYFWVLKALGIVLASGLAASAITTQIGTRFVLTTGQSSGDKDEDDDGDDEDDEDDGSKAAQNPFRGTGRATTDAQAQNKQRVAQEIRQRNIFCPTCEPEIPEGEEDGRPGTVATPVFDGETVAGIQPGETRSSLPLKLMATMEADDPTYSFATVFDTETEVAGLYGQGDSIRPGVIVVGVDTGLVHLRNGASLEYIQLGDEPPKVVAKPAAKPADDKPTAPRPGEIPGAEDAINCPTENTCIVERAFVEQLMANPAMLAKQARIVPSQKDGETQGFKFYGIRRGSLPNLIGLKNGDMLTEVNGEQLDGMDKAMALYTKLRRASNLTVTIERKGQRTTKEIQIQ
jgi:general secretion pathway protein C